MIGPVIPPVWPTRRSHQGGGLRRPARL